VILNIDDNMFIESILDGFSSLICHHSWSFLHGFLGNISRPCILHVEILGLKLCWDFGNKQVFCLSNLSIVVDLVQKGFNVFPKYGNLIWAIKQFLL
jgi:hypothetical protein